MDAHGRPAGRTLSISAHNPDTKSAFRESKSCADASPKDAHSADGMVWSPTSAAMPASKVSALPSHCGPRTPVNADPFTAWLYTFAPSGGRNAWHTFKLATLNPPISEESLKELDIMRIVANVRLRHDINFDRELHFKPNVDGEKGKEKQLLASQYWQALEVEMELCEFLLTAPEPFKWNPLIQDHLQESMQRLPIMFKTIKEVIVSLMPANDRNKVDEMLDVTYIIQAISRGVFDMSGLAHWLAQLLKAHCAPMRDTWVDRMEALMCGEHSEGISPAKHVVIAMKELFGILEAMKLDVANHQIRYLRPHLVANTFAFEQHYHTRRIVEGKFDVLAAYKWYEESTKQCQPRSERRGSGSSSSVDNDRFAAFTKAWLECITPQAADDLKTILPATFKMDLERLQGVQSDVKNLVFTQICCTALRTIAATIDPGFRLSDDADFVVMERVSQLVGRTPNAARWQEKAGNICVELIRICGEFMPQKRQTIDSMLGTLCSALEPYLQANLRVESAAFGQAAAGIMRNIIRLTVEAGQKIQRSSSNEIFDALAPPLPSNVSEQTKEYYAQSGPSLFSGSAASAGSLLDIVRRVTQISILHWRVWGPLVYEGDAEMTDELQTPERPSSAGSTGSTGSVSRRLNGFSFNTSSPGQGRDEGYCSSHESSDDAKPEDGDSPAP